MIWKAGIWKAGSQWKSSIKTDHYRKEFACWVRGSNLIKSNREATVSSANAAIDLIITKPLRWMTTFGRPLSKKTPLRTLCIPSVTRESALFIFYTVRKGERIACKWKLAAPKDRLKWSDFTTDPSVYMMVTGISAGDGEKVVRLVETCVETCEM